jgi:sterol desaturase/sphingolipid hydroxylase (fatty acid hydroxylase superfamily)
MTQNIYAYLTPLAIVFILLEIGLVFIFRKKYIRFQEAIANFGTALGNQTVNVLVAAGVYVVYGWLWSNFHLINGLTITNPVHFIWLLLGVDFIFYWVHRWGHEVNIMWAAHSPHHSAEEMNYLVALRASVTQRLFSFLFFWPLTIIGFKPEHIYMMTGLHLFIAFLHHTEFIPKLWRWIEFLFTTPSHHRVHHGVNYRYLNKNYGEFLIIWDRLFGSFAEEKEKVVYGMYNGPQSWNPIYINFHYYIQLWKIARQSKSIWAKITIWFRPLGWLPKDVPPKPTVPEMTLTNQVKYSTLMFPMAKPYLIVQTIFGVILMLLIISPNSSWEVHEKIIGAFILWQMIINWSGILERKKWVLASETIRIFLMSAGVIYFSNLLEQPVLLGVFLVLQILSLAWCYIYFKQEEETGVKAAL